MASPAIRTQLDRAYPALKENLKLHLNPERSYVVELKPSLTKQAASHVPTLVASVNSDAARLLLDCRGRKTIRSVLADNKTSAAEDEYEDMISFLEQAVASGHVILHTQPGPLDSTVHTGSLECHIPAHISVEVTKKCNLKCTYCYAADVDSPSTEEIGLDLQIQALEQWRKLGLISLELTGGEPTIAPHFPELLRYCTQNLSLTGILTNGTNMSADILEIIADAPYRVLVSLSLDASTPERFQALTGGSEAMFSSILSAIKALSKLDLSVNVAMTAIPETIDDIHSLALLTKSLGATMFGVANVMPVGRGIAHGWNWTSDDHKRFCTEMERIKDVYPEGASNSLENEAIRSTLEHDSDCGFGKRVAVLTATGGVKPCPVAPDTWSIGSVRTQTIETILHSEPYRRMAGMQAPSESLCQGCVYESSCRGCYVKPFTIAEQTGCTCRWSEESDLVPWLAEDTSANVQSLARTGTVHHDVAQSMKPCRDFKKNSCDR